MNEKISEENISISISSFTNIKPINALNNNVKEKKELKQSEIEKLHLENASLQNVFETNEIPKVHPMHINTISSVKLPKKKKPNGIASAPVSPLKDIINNDNLLLKLKLNENNKNNSMNTIDLNLNEVKQSTNESTTTKEKVHFRRRSVSDIPVHSTSIPDPEPGSPADFALVLANVKVDATILDKRMRIGKTKIGRTKYNPNTRFKKQVTGNIINSQHEQYALTFGMMAGIRNSAGLQNPFKQKLSMDDFMRVEKRNFPATQKLRHPFKFKDYSPEIFRQIRRRFSIDSADYMLTLCGEFDYIEFISNSKSGQFFFYSHDGRFMIKTQTKTESKFLRRILPHYYKFVMENPHTLITRFYGMHRVKMHHLRRETHFVIMASVYNTPKEIHIQYDIKGSKIGRETKKDDKKNVVLKDMDLINNNTKIEIGRERRAMVLEQLRKDVEFLKNMKIMDYSMLIGIYDPLLSSKEIKNKKNIEKQMGELFLRGPSSSESNLHLNHHENINRRASFEDKINKNEWENEINKSRTVSDDFNKSNIELNKECFIKQENKNKLENTMELNINNNNNNKENKMNNNNNNDKDFHIKEYEEFDYEYDSDNDSDLDMMEPISPRLLNVGNFQTNLESVFTMDEGGMYGKNPDGTKNKKIYYMGIIDILQQYNSRKIAETFIKGFRHNKKQISAVHPAFYGDRFISFIEQHVLGSSVPSIIMSQTMEKNRMVSPRPFNQQEKIMNPSVGTLQEKQKILSPTVTTSIPTPISISKTSSPLSTLLSPSFFKGKKKMDLNES